MKSPPRSFTVAELAQRLGGALHGPGEIRIAGINSVTDAGPNEVTYIADAPHAKLLSQSKAGAAVVSQSLQATLSDDRRPLIFVKDAEFASIQLLQAFEVPQPLPEPGVHPSAVIDASVQVGTDVRIGPHASVDADSVLGHGVILHAGVRIGPNVVIGDQSVIHANTVIRHNCTIGRRVLMHQNVSIGADGFGFRPSPDGRGLVKIPHIGTVIIEDDVEIGANTCIDRGKFGATVIGAGTKIDNLVQIAHNCRIGRSCLIAAQTGLSGSVEVGDGVLIGGQVAVKEHVKIGSGAKIGATSGVIGNLPAGGVYMGRPARPAMEALRHEAAQRKLPDLIRRLSRSRGESGPAKD